jgi:hypothetical protein
MLEVLEVKAMSIVAKLFFTKKHHTFHDKSKVASDIAQKCMWKRSTIIMHLVYVISNSSVTIYLLEHIHVV